MGAAQAVFCILGETIEGATDERYYRVRPCGRRRRLTPLPSGADLEVEDLFRPLFPVHRRLEATDDAPGDAPRQAGLPGLTDAASPVATDERIVAA